MTTGESVNPRFTFPAEPKGPTGKKVFIGLPVHEAVNPHFFEAVLGFQQEAFARKIANTSTFSGKIERHLGDSAIQRARNSLTRRFLESDCTDLLFIDSDIHFTYGQVERIMSHDVDVVGGLYFGKSEGPAKPIINAKIGYKCSEEGEANNLFQVNYIGTGFLRIRRTVFEQIIARWGNDLWYMLDPDHTVKEYDFWHMGVCTFENGLRRFLTEDWWFCQMCQELGVKVWADAKVVLGHADGGTIYPLSYQKQQLFSRPAPVGTSDSAAGAVSPQCHAAQI